MTVGHRIYPQKWVTSSYEGEYEGFQKRHIFRFRGRKNIRYLVYIEKYKETNVYAVKFFPKNSADSKHKYNIATNAHESRNIYATVLDLLEHFRSVYDQEASFFYLAAPTPICEGYNDNRKFNFYLRMSNDLISPSSWVLFPKKDSSAMIMVSRETMTRYPNIINDIRVMVDEVFSTLKYEPQCCEGCDTTCENYIFHNSDSGIEQSGKPADQNGLGSISGDIH